MVTRKSHKNDKLHRNPNGIGVCLTSGGEIRQNLSEKADGLGTLFLVNGEKYIGEFKQDMVNGSGTFHCLNGAVIQGEWVCNKLVEQGQ